MAMTAPGNPLPQPVKDEHPQHGRQRGTPEPVRQAAALLLEPLADAVHQLVVGLPLRCLDGRQRGVMPRPAPWSRYVFPLAQPVREPLGWHRLPEEKALADVAPQLLQFGPDGLGLDSFGDDPDAESMSHIDGGADDGPERRVASYRPDERNIKLELIDRPAAQAFQRGKAGAEVVQGDTHAELGELGEEGRAYRRGPGLLADLQDEHATRYVFAAQVLGDDGRESRIGHAFGSGIDRDRNTPSPGGPGPVLPERQPQHQLG